MSSPEQPTNPPEPTQPEAPVRLRSSHYGELKEHELIQLLDSVYDERSRARFRESIYLSMFVWIAIAWFLFYGPQVLFHAPRLVDPATLLRKQHQEEIAQLNLPPELRKAAPPRPKPLAKPPTVDNKTLEKLRAAEPLPAPTPTPPPPQPTSQPTITPPVPPPPPAPQPARAPVQSPVPDAPAPQVAFNRPDSAADAIRNAANAATRNGYGSLPTGPSHSTGRPGLTAGATIVSDTQGVDFSAYMSRLHDIIEHSWLPLLPESVRPPISERGATGLDFKILPNGDLGGIYIITPSGEHALDRAAWDSITTVGRFPPLPKEFHGPLLELNCGFFVNEQPPGD